MSADRGLISGDQYLRGLFVFVYQAIRKRLLLIVAATIVVAAIAYFAAPSPAPIFTLQTSIKKGKVTGLELLESVRRIGRDANLVGMEIVEVAPPYDHADVTAMLANRVVLETLSGMARRREDARTGVRWDESTPVLDGLLDGEPGGPGDLGGPVDPGGVVAEPLGSVGVGERRAL